MLFVPLVKPSGEKLTYYSDVIMGTMASQITSRTIVYSTVYSRRRSKKTSKLRVTGLCARNSPVTGEFPAQMASNAEDVSIWWRHHGKTPPVPHLCTASRWLFTSPSDLAIRWATWIQYSKPRIRRCHYLPPGSRHALGASESLSCSHVSFKLK